MNQTVKSAIENNLCVLPSIGLSIVLVSLFATSGSAAVINYDRTYVSLYDGSTFNDSLLANTGGTPLTLSIPGYSSTATTSFSPTVSSVAFDQLRSGIFASDSYGEAVVRFIAGSNESYSISGSFSNSGGMTRLNGSLFDHTTVSQVFLSAQVNIGATTLNVGSQLGNDFNFLSGNATGLLIPGHLYEWNSFAFIQALPSADGGATGFGFASIQIESLSPLPEPGSFTVFSYLGLVALLSCSRRTTTLRAAPDILN